ncbi:protodermal factor 1 [Corylus avellana]|uniref:protodermal factor 1 n=1 Tax=Corylus avellana TaxID=13451 RepID=UPI001E214AEF|nr:protodermal factor 1 [Corylus avellana]
MERVPSKLASLYVCSVVAALLSHNMMIHVMSTAVEDQKNYYSPEPHPPRGGHHGHTPSHGGYGTPPSGHGGGSYGPTPSPPSDGGSYGPTPSPPSGGYGGTPPSHGGSGSYNPTPSTPSYNPPPSTPSYDPPPSTPYYNPPPSTPSYDPPPSTPYYNPPPSTPSDGNCGTPPHHDETPPSTPGGYYNSPPPYSGGSPPTPVTVSPPTTPTPPSPPFVFDPNTPGTCNYWRSHPAVIWGLLGWWGTLGNAFGVTSVPGFGSSVSLQQALSNTRTDGLGALYREGTASLLNSMVNQRFPFTTKQVRDSFVSALGSNRAAAAQAQLFKLANEGRIKPRP